MASLNMQPTNNTDKETLHLNATSGQVSGVLNVYTYVDKETHQFVGYSPAFEVSAYGETPEKMQQMMHEALKEFFKYLVNLSAKKRDEELTKLGWKKEHLRNKDFSKAYVDVSGELQNFAEPNTITKELMPF